MSVKIADMDLFIEIPGASVIISRSGLHQQVSLYTANSVLYAATKTGFIRLKHGHLTSVRTVRWESIHGIEYADQWDGPRRVFPKKPKVVASSGSPSGSRTRSSTKSSSKSRAVLKAIK